MYQEDLDIRQITNADTLRQMLAQCEDEIMRLAKDEGNCYYWPRETEDLVREELSTKGLRKLILPCCNWRRCTVFGTTIYITNLLPFVAWTVGRSI